MADGGSLTTEYRCGYCYQEFNSMADPKVLPCSHVFCLTCLEGDYADNSVVLCRICQRVHELSEFGNLPTATLSTTTEEIHSSTELTCDCENCEDGMAVGYCINCLDKICDTHLQSHNSYFGKRHEIIPISTYEQSPGKYKKVLCVHHKEELIKACQECDKLVCVECDVHERSCSADQSEHKFSSTNKIKEEITTQFNKLLKTVNDKLTEICKLDKRIWSILDVEEVECKVKIDMIEEFCKEQMERIREECEKLKEDVYAYERRLTNQVEVYNTELMAKKEQLEESRTKVHRWLRDSHVTEKVKERQQMRDELTKSQNIELKFIPLSKPVLIHGAEKQGKPLQLATVPASITFSSELGTDESCYSAFYQPCGRLLVGCCGGVQFISTDPALTSPDFQIFAGSVTAVEYQGAVYVLSASIATSTYQVEMCLPDLTQKYKLFQFNYTNTIVPFLSVSDRYIAVCNPASEKLILYDFTSKQTTILQPDIPPGVAYFLSNGDLLCTGYGKSELTRYRIEDGKLTTLWSCDGLYDACGVCTDEEGLIYVSSYSNKTIYIISPQGKKLQEFSLDKLPPKAGQISIRGDNLAVPGWDDETLYIFKLNH